jgi:hypothetical protein
LRAGHVEMRKKDLEISALTLKTNSLTTPDPF